MDKFRIKPYWWPIITLATPLLLPFLYMKNKKYKSNKEKARRLNEKRIKKSDKFELPAVDFLELTALVEWKNKEGFMGDAGVSYLFKTDRGKLLFDIGHGPGNKTLEYNANKLDFNLDQVDALAISHLHKDHMGGMEAAQKNNVMVPSKLRSERNIDCYLPDNSKADNFNPIVVDSPRYLGGGFTSTGPLARSLFLLGYTEEQALIVNIKDKGLAIFTGCGHPTIKVILDIVKKISDKPIYAIGGGLHFPLTEGRGSKAGFELQQIFGTGKPPWQKINKDDIEDTINIINKADPEKVFLSAHDSCDNAMQILQEKLNADTNILQAGGTYKI